MWGESTGVIFLREGCAWCGNSCHFCIVDNGCRAEVCAGFFSPAGMVFFFVRKTWRVGSDIAALMSLFLPHTDSHSHRKSGAV